MPSLTLGSRTSSLALAQAALTATALQKANPALHIDIVAMKTTGDKNLTLSLQELANQQASLEKGLFTKELENALSTGVVDIAVHSMKDVPTTLADPFVIAGCLPAQCPDDLLIVKKHIPQHALWQSIQTVGTGSQRRIAQLLWHFPHLTTCHIRGNIASRLGKLAQNPSLDALVLAKAGLMRLGYLDGEKNLPYPNTPLESFRVISLHPLCLPAPSQGIIGFETLKSNHFAQTMIHSITHQESFLSLQAQRHALRLLEGGCSTPFGISCILKKGKILLHGRFFETSNYTFPPREAQASHTCPIEAACLLHKKLTT